MITVAIPIMGALLWLWLAFAFTVWFSFNCLMAMWGGRYIQGAIWGSLAYAGICWWRQDDWLPHPWQVEHWLETSAWYVGFAVVCVILYKLKQRRQAIADVPAFGTLPVTEGNVVPFIHANRIEKERVMQIQDYKCANPYCNSDLRGSTPHWDHILPRSKGGTDSVHNGQWLCDTCNLNKGNMDWLEFMFRYATGMGMDPNANQKPWQKWVLTRTQNGLQCQG